ncbi:hypothetical protein ACIA8F_25205 [Streptomyces sp. NPDC051563]|uniref:hypothetical protein n=1 Tax=Streptomyces sp. NPDC051563 TaxID=3365659 RepID=UPI00379B5D07
MADTEDTPPARQHLPTVPPTRVLPEQPTPATLPDPADLRPVGPARRWTWLLAGLAAGAGAIALALSLVANLTDPAPAAAPAAGVTATGAPPTQPHTTLVDGCALLRPETVERHIKGATCIASPSSGGASSRGTWTSKQAGYADMEVEIVLSPSAESIYQETLTLDRTTATTTGAKITDDRSVPGLGDKATLLYTDYGSSGRVSLSVLQKNALIGVEYSGFTSSGLTVKNIPRDIAEAAAIACAKDALATLTTP